MRAAAATMLLYTCNRLRNAQQHIHSILRRPVSSSGRLPRTSWSFMFAVMHGEAKVVLGEKLSSFPLLPGHSWLLGLVLGRAHGVAGFRGRTPKESARKACSGRRPTRHLQRGRCSGGVRNARISPAGTRSSELNFVIGHAIFQNPALSSGHGRGGGLRCSGRDCI